jgi:prophage regulatory protein
MGKKFIRLPTVTGQTGLSPSTIWSRISEGTFPAPIKIGAQAVGWIDSEVDEWMEQMIEASRGKDVLGENPTPPKSSKPHTSLDSSSVGNLLVQKGRQNHAKTPK